ncbi:hypothetical protein BDN70DRAFT_45609 [Pholiota conissans]|uniref:Uncharacterized protein n=1 Tax=Pholiota conissans TaxID=109636 RepID=A0A9P6CSM6_9AGAR|nr:hypothetical protein BDN70DRAFT_45609 [Pholiota conissans]
MSVKTTSPSRAQPHCRTCGNPMRGHNRERCRLLSGPGNLSYREKDDAQSFATSDARNGSSSSEMTLRGAAHAYLSPPATPSPQSNWPNQLAGRLAKLNPFTNEAVVPVYGPPPPVYPPAPLSDVSYEIPENGYYHHVNKNFKRPVAAPLPSRGAFVPPTEVSMATTEPISDSDVNRAPSPGPSAFAFMSGNEGDSVGPSLSERMRSLPRMMPAFHFASPQPTAGPSGSRPSHLHLGFAPEPRDQTPVGPTPRFSEAAGKATTTAIGKYTYWPGNAPPAVPFMTPKARAIEAFKNLDFGDAIEDITDGMVEIIKRPSVMLVLIIMVLFLIVVFGTVLGGYITKKFL